MSNSIDLRGSICLSDIPKELIKKAANGKCYLNINIWEKKEPSTFKNNDGTTRTYTHSVQCACKKEDMRTDVPKSYYYIGDLETRTPFGGVSAPTPEEIDNAPTADGDDLPF